MSLMTVLELLSEPNLSIDMTNDYIDPEDSEIVIEAKKISVEPVDYSYTERDVILYNLGIGATEKDLQWTYEGDDQFAALPTFGVIPQFHAMGSVPLDFLPNFNPVSRASGVFVVVLFIRCKAKLLHGEQYLAIKAPIPVQGDLVSEGRSVIMLCRVLSKGSLC